MHAGAIQLQCHEGEVQLVNGSVPNEGRVEVCVDSVWGTICNDRWGSDDAEVVCRQLGYRTNGRLTIHVVIMQSLTVDHAVQESCTILQFPLV